MSLLALHIIILKGEFDCLKFNKKLRLGWGGGSDFSHKKGGFGKNRGVVLKKGVTYFHTNPFQYYLSECLFFLGVFCLFKPFLSVFFVFDRKNLILFTYLIKSTDIWVTDSCRDG